MAFRQIKSPALADKAVINTKLDESAVQGQSTLTGMVNPAECFTLLYDVGSDSLKKISGRYYPVRGKKLDKIIYDIQNNRQFRSTLGGCIVEKVNRTIIISKEC